MAGGAINTVCAGVGGLIITNPGCGDDAEAPWPDPFGPFGPFDPFPFDEAGADVEVWD